MDVETKSERFIKVGYMLHSLPREIFVFSYAKLRKTVHPLMS